MRAHVTRGERTKRGTSRAIDASPPPASFPGAAGRAGRPPPAPSFLWKSPLNFCTAAATLSSAPPAPRSRSRSCSVRTICTRTSLSWRTSYASQISPSFAMRISFIAARSALSLRLATASSDSSSSAAEAAAEAAEAAVSASVARRSASAREDSREAIRSACVADGFERHDRRLERVRASRRRRRARPRRGRKPPPTRAPRQVRRRARHERRRRLRPRPSPRAPRRGGLELLRVGGGGRGFRRRRRRPTGLDDFRAAAPSQRRRISPPRRAKLRVGQRGAKGFHRRR